MWSIPMTSTFMFRSSTGTRKVDTSNVHEGKMVFLRWVFLFSQPDAIKTPICVLLFKSHRLRMQRPQICPFGKVSRPLKYITSSQLPSELHSRFAIRSAIQVG